MEATLKVITILLTAFFGVYASLTNFRDPSGRITRHGWVGLIGVIVAGLSAAGLQIYSDVQQEKSVLAILSEIDRTLHPLPGLSVTFSLRPDWEKEKFRSYFAKTEASFKHATSFGTLFFPKREESPLLHDTLCQVDVVLLFFREAVDLTKFKYNISGSGEDLEIHISNPCRISDLFSNLPIPMPVDMVRRFEWEFFLREKKLRRLDFTVDVRNIEATSHEWRSNGTITSLQDLLGAQLIVRLNAPGLPNSAEFSRDTIQEYRQAIDLAELLIRLQNGIVMRFDADNLQRSTVKDSLAIYSFTFPKTVSAVLKATEYKRFKKVDEEYGQKEER